MAATRVTPPKVSQRVFVVAGGAPAWTAANMTAYVPSIDQRRRRSQIDCHAPNSDGTSRHGEPVRNRHAIASNVAR
jgi:hypothetical protein